MRRLFLFCLFAIFIAAGFFRLNASVFTKEMYMVDGYSMPYRLLTPSDVSKKQPLVIFLHGAGERGTDNEQQLTSWNIEKFLSGFTGDYSAYILAPQCPKDDFWSAAMADVNGRFVFDFNKEEPTRSMKTLMSLINYWINSGKIDKDRIYVGGISMGGFGTYELLWRMAPKTFAAAFPICGATHMNNGKLESYAPYTPVWMFHGASDNIVPVSYSRTAYDRFKEIAGSKVKYTEYANVGHDSWANAFNDKNLIAWLFGHRNVELAYYKITSLGGAKSAITKSISNTLTLGKFENLNTQSWLIKEAANGKYQIQAADGSGLYLGINGRELILSAETGSANQAWTIASTGKDSYNIISASSGYFLELSDSGTLALAERKTDAVNQKWKVSHSKLYLIGGATPGGWYLNKAQEMVLEQGKDAVLSWSGFLWSGDFKFLSTQSASWETSYTAPTADRYPVSGKAQRLIVHPQNQYDYKFKLNQAGYYKLTADMANRNVIVSKEAISALYMVGAATPAGWDVYNPVNMQPVDGRKGVFTWSGFLNTGEFKFLVNKGLWTPSVNPVSAENVQSGKTYSIAFTDGVTNDYKFKISKSTYYTITVDTENMSATIKEKMTGIPLYLIGAAVPNVGWNNTTAIPLTALSDSIYTWSGYLHADRFKFITKLGTWNSIIPTRLEHETIINGYAHAISNDYRGDYCFVIPQASNYTITVNMASGTMTVNKNPQNNPVYLLGAAVPNADWYNTRAIPMTEVSDGVFRWDGHLYKGHFKFITELGTWRSIVPGKAAHEDIINGYLHEVSNYYQGDYRYNIPEAGNYTMVLDLVNHTLVIKRLNENIPLYLIGSAVPNVGWFNSKAVKMQSASDVEYTWSGYLYEGEFKFITQLGTWNSIVPEKAAHERIISGYTHRISNDYRGDYKFVISRAANYTITVNTKNRTLKVDDMMTLRNLESDGVASSDDYTVVGLQGSVEVRNSKNLPVNRIRLLDINGRVLDMVKNVNSTCYLGNNMAAGVYIVEIEGGGSVQHRKVLIR